MGEEPAAAPDRVDLMHARVAEVLRLVRRSDPEPACWMEDDASESFCWGCAQVERAKRMGLCRPVPEPVRKFTWDRDEKDEAHRDAYERFQEGIGGRYHGQGERDHTQHCARCGVLLAYSLTDYGARSEAEEWPQCRIRAVGDGWHPDASYGLDRLAMSFSYPSAPAWAIEAVIGIATDALSTTL